MTEREQLALQLATAHYRDESVRVRDVREQLDMSSTRFWQLVNHLVETQAALEHDPVGVNRLRRLRAARTRSRG